MLNLPNHRVVKISAGGGGLDSGFLLCVWDEPPKKGFPKEHLEILEKLAVDTFPEEDPGEVVKKDFLGHELYCSLWTSSGELVGISSWQVKDISFEGSHKLLYLCVIAVFSKWRGRGLSLYLYEEPIKAVHPDIIATTTKMPAVYLGLKQAGLKYQLVLWPTENGFVSRKVWQLGRAVLGQTGRGQGLERNLVRRGYMPRSQSQPYRDFGLFEKILKVQSEDGALLMALPPQNTKRR